MKIIHRNKYDLLIGDDSVELFDYFNVNELHGLKRSDAVNYNETNKDVFIAGMSNYHPSDRLLIKYPKPYVFINTKPLKNDFRDISLVMHEMIHQSLLQHNWDINLEEEIITWAENETNYIFKNSLIPSYEVPGLVYMTNHPLKATFSHIFKVKTKKPN